MQRGTIIVLSIVIIALIAALIIAYYQSASTKAVAAQCDKTKKVCQVRSETTRFGGYFPVYSYYYVPFPLYGPGLGMYYPGSIINTPNECDNCLNKITPPRRTRYSKFEGTCISIRFAVGPTSSTIITTS
jgi:hypothetical protein